MAKRETSCETDTDCPLFPYDVCDAGQCILGATLPNRPGKRDVPALCNIPGECTAYGPVPPPPEKRDTNKDVNCHNDEQCSPGICQDGICLLK
ncbi:uncharacterized protein ASPGLDRAFT_52319 [Aspergillus glaucus CBS 516.65]|uniref:Uncharacterized protein n=1 Tax=Aspergillus glaucus CBS 516.65 TaxID=1160497 RepID=A0A1L9V787_ASPGL|nr:hypothetical protein ASPGLDRAFT_52319 [Aspergillus glaucus CBS 516.65]OJJ79783.1 hypothetical protein ASPGLDRAFT_52319 [Aspergillus glaucus CBS 516.65]